MWATKEEGEAAAEKESAQSAQLRAEKHKKRLAKVCVYVCNICTRCVWGGMEMWVCGGVL